MNEPQPEFAVSKSYSLKIGHIGKVTDLSIRLEISPSAVVQAAIDAYYTQMADQPAEETPQPK